MEPIESEGRPGAVANEPFHALTVIALDADGRVDTEATGSLPSEHAVGQDDPFGERWAVEGDCRLGAVRYHFGYPA